LSVQLACRIGDRGNMSARLARQLRILQEATPRAEANSAT